MNKKLVKRNLAQAWSRITLSFDGWKSDNEVDYLGIVAHYIDKDFTVKAVLLALKNTFDNHTGLEMKEHLREACKDYKISTRIAYFMADNATPNDKAIELLTEHLELQPRKQRLRCTAHSINLVAKAILYGVDVDYITDALREAIEDDEDDDLQNDTVNAFEAALRGNSSEQSRLKIWRKKGPLGKLHNLIVHARMTPARRRIFALKQRETADEVSRLFELIIDGGVRWNSTHDMIERALKLKDAIELYQQHFRGDADALTDDDCLTNDDWHELKQLLDLLAPLKRQSVAVQADGIDNHGHLFEALSTLDLLITKLEDLKRKHQYEPTSHFKASINLG
jgi:hypothetical protein